MSSLHLVCRARSLGAYGPLAGETAKPAGTTLQGVLGQEGQNNLTGQEQPFSVNGGAQHRADQSEHGRVEHLNSLEVPFIF